MYCTIISSDRNGIGHEGAGSLERVLGQCSSLATLDLEHNNLGAEGARRMAVVLVQSSSLAQLNLRYNNLWVQTGLGTWQRC